MVSLVFDAIHSLWFTKDELSELPQDSAQLQLLALKESVDAQKHKLYVCNPNNLKLYRPFTYEFLENLEDIEGNSETLRLLKVELSTELGWVNVHVFSKSIVEIPIMLLKEIFVTFYEIVRDFIDLEFTFAASSSVCKILDALLQVVRVIYYGIGVMLSLVEGIWFNPARGALKCDTLFTRLNYGLPLEHGYFANPSGRRQPKDLDESMHLWYPDERVIQMGSLDEEVVCEQTFINRNRFDREGAIELQNARSESPEVFPLADYLVFHSRQNISWLFNQLLQQSKRVYDFVPN